ncbi:MAG: LETM1 domain-containing protein [Bacteroidota bacterium]
MFSAGKKNWIKKFFALVKEDKITLLGLETQESKENTLRLVCEHCGLLYGVPNKNIYTNHLVEHSTRTEKLQLLFFEGLLLTYTLNRTGNLDQEDFLQSLCSFFKLELSPSKTWLGRKKSPEKALLIERAIDERIRVQSSYIDKNYWFNHLTNPFLFIDVIAYHDFLQGKEQADDERQSSIELCLTVLAGMRRKANAQGVHFSEKLFKNLLNSSGLSDGQIALLGATSLEDSAYQTAKQALVQQELLLYFTLHFLALLHYRHDENLETPSEFMVEVGTELGLSREKNDEIFWEYRASLSAHSESFYNLLSESETKVITTHLSRKYRRVLGRNKDRLVQELKESQELVYLIRQSTKRELTAEEKEKVKEQSLDLLKTVPSIGIYLLPGGSLWLPIVLKLIPELLPSAFKENEVEEKK